MARVSAQERRRQLVGAAFRLVAREGVAAASTRRIAAEAGVPPAVVHYAFSSKQELLTSMMSLVFEESEQAARSALQPSEGVLGALSSAVERLFLAFESDPARHQAVFDLVSDALRHPDTASIVRDHQARLDGLAEGFLTDLAREARVTWSQPVPLLARLLISTLDGTLLAWLVDRDGPRARATLTWLTANIAGCAVPSSSSAVVGGSGT